MRLRERNFPDRRENRGVYLATVGSAGRRAMLVGEQVIALGIAAFLLVMLAAMVVQSRKASHLSQAGYEAQCLAENQLEALSNRGFSSYSLGSQALQSGQLQDGTAYRLQTEVYALTAQALSPDQARRVRVVVSWRDASGPHQRQSESCFSRMLK